MKYLCGPVAVVAVLCAALTAGCSDTIEGRASVDQYVPTDANPDPSSSIDGVTIIEYPPGNHVSPEQRVAYEHSPPFGGPHDSYWAQCTGTVYDEAIRTENAVHSLEHGAVWITYDPAQVSDAERERLEKRVEGNTYLMMSPYPELAAPISLQSWGHQLFVDSATDVRIAQFISALRVNPNTYPEPGATCASRPGGFDPDNPPPFDPSVPDPNSPNTVPE